MRFPRAVPFLVCLTLNTFSLFAQSPNGNINGLVSDPSNAAVVGAEIVAVNDVTGVQYTTKTNTEGIYVLPNLPPGPYRVQVSKVGFKTLIKPDIVLNVQDSLSINFALVIGAFHEVVTVQGGGPLVNTESAAVGTVIDRKFVESLPLNGRSFNTLLQLTPGVVIAPSDNGGGNPGQFSIAGQRTDANNFTVDGVSANFGVSLGTAGYMGSAGTGSAQAFSVLGGTSSLVSVEDLQEFRTVTSSFAAEFGRQPGGQVLLTTRSGTNEFHGGLFEYFRNDLMDANNWFANHAGLPRAAERHNDFGGFFGGPIFRGKTFFFLSYEGARLRQPQTTSILVPSVYARSQAGEGPVAPYLNAYPQPDDSTVVPGVFVSPFTGNVSNSATLNAGSLRIDHTVNNKMSIFGRFNESPSEQAKPVQSLSTSQSSEVNTRTLTLGYNWTFTANAGTSLRANYSTQKADTVYSLTSLGQAAPLDASQLYGNLASGATFADFSTLDTGGYDLQAGPVARNRARQLNFVGDLFLTKGKHQFKFGSDYRLIFTHTLPSEHTVAFTAASIESLLSSPEVSLFAASSDSARFVSRALSLYAQDSWKVLSRLTLDYGIRWELSPAPSPQGDTIFAAWENLADPSAIRLAPLGRALWNTTYRNFAPRIGAAYSLSPSGDFVLRGGWGIFYDLGVGTSANVATTFPNGVSQFTPTVALPPGDLTPSLPEISLVVPYPSGQIYAFANDLQLPKSYQWNVALEKSFGKQVLSATYVGQVGRDLLRQQSLSTPNADFSPGTLFYVTGNSARSKYNALQLQYRRPLGENLQAVVNYSWSHSLDDVSDDTGVTISDTVIQNAQDWGSSSFDVRHSVSGALSYRMPHFRSSGLASRLAGGWAFNFLGVARTGFPFNAVYLLLGAVSGTAYPRPDLVPGQPLWTASSESPGGKILNAAAFVAPPVLRQGSEPRNDIRGFSLIQIDSSISREFRLTDVFRLQFRADAFNLLNHPNFTNPLAYVGLGPFFLQSYATANTGLGGLNPLFQEGGPRSLQLSLRLSF